MLYENRFVSVISILFLAAGAWADTTPSSTPSQDACSSSANTPGTQVATYCTAAKGDSEAASDHHTMMFIWGAAAVVCTYECVASSFTGAPMVSGWICPVADGAAGIADMIFSQKLSKDLKNMQQKNMVPVSTGGTGGTQSYLDQSFKNGFILSREDFIKMAIGLPLPKAFDHRYHPVATLEGFGPVDWGKLAALEAPITIPVAKRVSALAAIPGVKVADVMAIGSDGTNLGTPVGQNIPSSAGSNFYLQDGGDLAGGYSQYNIIQTPDGSGNLIAVEPGSSTPVMYQGDGGQWYWSNDNMPVDSKVSLDKPPGAPAAAHTDIGACIGAAVALGMTYMEYSGGQQSKSSEKKNREYANELAASQSATSAATVASASTPAPTPSSSGNAGSTPAPTATAVAVAHELDSGSGSASIGTSGAVSGGLTESGGSGSTTGASSAVASTGGEAATAAYSSTFSQPQCNGSAGAILACAGPALPAAFQLPSFAGKFQQISHQSLGAFLSSDAEGVTPEQLVIQGLWPSLTNQGRGEITTALHNYKNSYDAHGGDQLMAAYDRGPGAAGLAMRTPVEPEADAQSGASATASGQGALALRQSISYGISRGPATTAEDKTISLFDRVATRYQALRYRLDPSKAILRDWSAPVSK